MTEIRSWMKSYAEKAQETFAGRIRFIGLQGSYGRGEAFENSDIDVVLILDRLDAEDLKKYSDMLDTLPQRELVCGFVSGWAEIENWEASDLFQFCHDTIPVIGSLDRLMEKIHREEVQRAVKIGACNIYHMCVHNMVHEKDAGILRELYKSARFTVQAVLYLQTGQYEKQRSRMMPLLLPGERLIMENEAEIRRILNAGQCPDKEFARLSNELLAWASEWIQGRTFSLSPEKEEGLS